MYFQELIKARETLSRIVGRLTDFGNLRLRNTSSKFQILKEFGLSIHNFFEAKFCGS